MMGKFFYAAIALASTRLAGSTPALTLFLIERLLLLLPTNAPNSASIAFNMKEKERYAHTKGNGFGER